MSFEEYWIDSRQDVALGDNSWSSKAIKEVLRCFVSYHIYNIFYYSCSVVGIEVCISWTITKYKFAVTKNLKLACVSFCFAILQHTTNNSNYCAFISHKSTNGQTEMCFIAECIRWIEKEGKIGGDRQGVFLRQITPRA